MKSFKELKKAIRDNSPLVWNDPDPIKDADYTIKWIEPITDEFDENSFILIQYGGNNGVLSEAQVFLHEILYKQKN